jgi:hypothetical protein
MKPGTKFTIAALGSIIVLLGGCDANDRTNDNTTPPAAQQQNPAPTPPNNQPTTPPPAPEN